MHLGLYRNVAIYLKLEGQNPSGALKDRLVSWVMSQTPKSEWGGKTLLDASSGSQGCALALWGARNSTKVTIVSNSKVSEENRRAICALGATLRLEGKVTKDSRNHCLSMIEESPEEYFFFDQLGRIGAHHAYKAIATEILRDLPEIKNIVASKGSGVTLLGICSATHDTEVNVYGTIGLKGDQSIVGTYKPGSDYETDSILQLPKQHSYCGDMAVSYNEVMTVWKSLLALGYMVGPQGAGVYWSIIKLIQRGEITESVVGVVGDTGLKHLSRLK